MSIEMIEAIGKFIVTPICGAVAFWIFFHYISKD